MKSFEGIPGSSSSGKVKSSRVLPLVNPFLIVTGFAASPVAAKTNISLFEVSSISVLLPPSIWNL